MSEYAYHVTPIANLDRIKATGLVPQSGGEQYNNPYGKRVYFAYIPNEAFYYVSIAHGLDNNIILLRVKKADLELNDPNAKESWTNEIVQPNLIEFYDGSKWQNISLAENKFYDISEFLEDRDKEVYMKRFKKSFIIDSILKEARVEEYQNIDEIFKQKQTADTYLDIKNFWREKLGEGEEWNLKGKIQLFRDEAKEETININKIIPNQEYLNDETLDNYKKNLPTKLPAGVKFKNGNVVLFDGHHTVAAQIMNGVTNIKMLILKA